ncbi:hypothetical protein [Rickettsia endosymbiont of Orchestes rusci]
MPAWTAEAAIAKRQCPRGSKIAIFRIFFKSTAVSYRGLPHYCTNI